jgi:hypothetical protein
MLSPVREPALNTRHMSTKAREAPRGWTPLICLGWLICELVLAWLIGGWDSSEGTWLLMTSVPGLAFGLAIGREARAAWMLTVPLAAVLTTVVSTISVYNAGGEPDPALALPFIVVQLGSPVVAGVVLGAMWRLVVKLVARRSTHS